MRALLLASTFALVSTAAFANNPAPAAPTQAQHQTANGGAGGQGGAGGTGIAASSAAARSHSSSRSSASNSIGAGSGSNNNETLTAPGMALGSFGGGYDCPVVGLGGGGYGQGGALAEFTHLSQDCNDRKVATEVIAPTMGWAAANDWMVHQNSEYRDWYSGYVKRASQQSAAFDCNGPHTNTEWRVHPECAK